MAVPPSAFKFRHIPELDGFRGLAITLVVIGRYWEFHGANSDIRSLFQHTAQLGVLLFFVLSGFLITGLLYRELSLSGRINFKRFYIRRVLRLTPALWLFLLTVVLLIRFGAVTDVSRTELVECFVYLRNIFGHSLTIGHIWSLSLEEQFYILWPVSFLLISRGRALPIIAGICFAFMIWRGLAIHLHLFAYERGIFYVRPYFRFDSLLIGALLVLSLSSSEKLYNLLQRLARIPWAIPAWCVIFLWAAIGERCSRALHITVSEILVAAVLLHVVLRPESLAARICRTRALRFMGLISYSVYLWQELFISVEPPSWGILRELPLSFVIPIGIAITSFYLVERPILKLKNRLAPEVLSAEL